MLGSTSLSPAGSGFDSLVPPRKTMGDARVDMTAMIDLVFMMNIFFLVTSLVAALGEVDLPAAKHVVGADLETSVVLTVVANGEAGRPSVYVGEDTSEGALPDAQQDELIAAAVERAVHEGRKTVIVKGERKVQSGDIKRVARAAARRGNQTQLCRNGKGLTGVRLVAHRCCVFTAQHVVIA